MNDFYRWILSPLENTPEGRKLPVCRVHTLHWNAPQYNEDGTALVYCHMNMHQFLAAQADVRLTVLGSVLEDDPVPDVVITKHQGKHKGLKKGMKLKEVLKEMAKQDPRYHHQH